MSHEFIIFAKHVSVTHTQQDYTWQGPAGDTNAEKLMPDGVECLFFYRRFKPRLLHGNLHIWIRIPYTQNSGLREEETESLGS